MNITKYIKSIKAFTLLELIIVVVILGILASIAIPLYTNAVEQRRGEVCINNIRMIIAAEKIYYMKNHTYWPEPAYSNSDLSTINSTLNIEIQDNNFSYSVQNFTYDPTGIYWMRIECQRQSGRYQYHTLNCQWFPLNPVETSLEWYGTWFPDDQDPPSFPLPED